MLTHLRYGTFIFFGVSMIVFPIQLDTQFPPPGILIPRWYIHLVLCKSCLIIRAIYQCS